MDKKYKLDIDPRILELLGPNLYTNVYYVLAELIANAYDADAKNVYVIANEDNITVEDDGEGMSYSNGDIDKYLHVAAVSRLTEEDSTTKSGRFKMGRKGVGKLAALSVSDYITVKTVKNGEKSGFVFSREINEDKLLPPISEEEISFEKIKDNGTSIVMHSPKYKLPNSLDSIKRNFLRIFPLFSEDFKLHIISGKDEVTVKEYDKEIISQLSTLITIGKDFALLDELFSTEFEKNKGQLLKHFDTVNREITMFNIQGEEKKYNLEINGWIGTYKTTKGRKINMTDFPDNFISLYSNKKMGEFNILPIVGKNKLAEVYVVGQLHIDLFELTELPDMALSNRQGYKTDDPRYQEVLEYVRETLLPYIINMRDIYVDLKKEEREKQKIEKLKEQEKDFRRSVDNFRNKTSKKAASRIASKLGTGKTQEEDIKNILEEEINANSPDMGIKSIIDSQKKKILISQTYADKDLADIVYSMLVFNNVPPEDIIYTNCDDEKSRIPEGDVGKSGIYDYLREFFVNSYSTQKIYVLFVTSNKTKESWGALTEVGAAWITQIEHKIFNIYNFRPEHPLDDESQWHTSFRDDKNELYMSNLSIDIFSQKIEYICDKLGYTKQTRDKNNAYLKTLVNVKNT